MSLGPNSFRPVITRRVRHNSRSAMFAYNAARTRKIVSKPFVKGGEIAKYTYQGARVFSAAHPFATRVGVITAVGFGTQALVVGAMVHQGKKADRRTRAMNAHRRAAGYQGKPTLTFAQRQVAARKRRRVQGRFA